MKDIDRIHFTSRDHKVMFRHRQVGGRITYSMEDYQGKVLTEVLEPQVGFEIWTIRQVEELLGEYGIVKAGSGRSVGRRDTMIEAGVHIPVGRTDSETLAREDRLHRNINS